MNKKKKKDHENQENIYAIKAKRDFEKKNYKKKQKKKKKKGKKNGYKDRKRKIKRN